MILLDNSQFLGFLSQLICRIEGVGGDVVVLRTVRQGLVYLHAVVIGVGGEDTGGATY